MTLKAQETYCPNLEIDVTTKSTISQPFSKLSSRLHVDLQSRLLAADVPFKRTEHI